MYDPLLLAFCLLSQGMNVVTVIHQPRYSNFAMFDTVLLLGTGGRTVYLGPTAFAAAYFELCGFIAPPLENMADFILDVISGAVSRKGDPDFMQADLFQLWDSNGAELLLEAQEDNGG